MTPFSSAILDYFKQSGKKKLWIETSYGTREEMPVDVYFRSPLAFTTLEHLAVNLCEGSILDVGACAGAMTLDLQQKGFDVTGLEIENTLVNIMKERGVNNAMHANIFDIKAKRFDTILMMMNGIGLVGNMGGLEKFLIHAKSLITNHGQLLLDSSDITYLYEDMPMPSDRYFGEISYRYCYGRQKGNWFDWLYVDADKLTQVASAMGWMVEVVYTDEYDQYLARLILNEIS